MADEHLCNNSNYNKYIFSALAGQHFHHIDILLTFSALAGQHFHHTDILLTFSPPPGQHLCRRRRLKGLCVFMQGSEKGQMLYTLPLNSYGVMLLCPEILFADHFFSHFGKLILGKCAVHLHKLILYVIFYPCHALHFAYPDI